MDYKKTIAQRIARIINIDAEEIEKMIEIPSDASLGDFALPCFKLSKVMKKSPKLIADELVSSIDKEGFEKVDSISGYLNFFIEKAAFTEKTILNIISEGDCYGNSNDGAGKTVTIDYSSPNIAKPFHVGHLYSTAIGSSLYKLFSSQGYKAVGIDHIGDWGTQFGKLITAYDRWVDKDALEKDPINEMLRIYVKFHEEAEKDPELEDIARHHFKALEDGCPHETELWKKMKDLSMKEFNRIYDMLGITFDSYAGESFYNDKMDVVIDELEDKGLLEESNGAQVVKLDDYNMPPCIIKKSDGATIYATRDLAAAIYRDKTYHFYKNIYVVGSDQTLYFKQVFTVLKLMGHDFADRCIHVGFGLVKFEDKKLSTRKGDVIFLEDVLNEAVSRSREIIENKNPNLENKDDLAKKIGIGAVIFTYLKNNRERDIIFNWNEILNFDGETGPYVQYTYARGRSILRKASQEDFNATPDFTDMVSPEEFELSKLLSTFNNAINFALEKYEPSIVTRYVIDVAKSFNKLYNMHPILSCKNEGLKSARLKLVEASTIVIKKALSLLGIEVVERM